MIKIIMFDIGGVILNYTEDRYYRYITKKLKINYEEFIELMGPLIELMELGKLRHSEAEDILARRFGIRRGQLEWASAFNKLAKPDRKVMALVNRLSGRYRVLILSDISKSRFSEIEKPVLSKLNIEKVFASFAIGKRKGSLDPKEWPYAYVLNKMKAKANEMLFIDNMKYNIKGAERIGIRGIVFKNYSQLLTELKKRGINTR